MRRSTFATRSTLSTSSSRHSGPTEVLNYFERFGFGPARLDSRSARWLKGRYKGQIEDLMEEQSLAKAILGSIEPATGPASRVIEVAMAATRRRSSRRSSCGSIRSLRQMEANMAEANKGAAGGGRLCGGGFGAVRARRGNVSECHNMVQGPLRETRGRILYLRL